MSRSTIFTTSDQAEDSFYLAFEKCDIELMMSVWSKDKEIACIHPGGSRLEGVESIRDSWAQIFSYEQAITFDLKHKKVLVIKDIAIHHVIEVIYMNGKLSSEIFATNVYCKAHNSWNMILHHASPELHKGADPSELSEIGEIQTVH